MAKGFVLPSNEVLIAGRPLVIELKVETATNVAPGRLVRRDSSGTNIEVCDSTEKPIGWVGYGQGHPNYCPTNIDTAYAVNSFAPVLFGGNFVISAEITDGEDIDLGDYLICGTAGECVEAAAITATAAEGTTTIVKPDITVAGSVPPGGIIVGIAMGEAAPSGANGRCAVSSLI